METYSPPSQHYESYARSRRPYFKKIGNGGTIRVPKNLPVELHELIVNELEGETEALKQCSLTCWLYRHFAQRLLFKSMMFKFLTFLGLPTADEFLDVLRVSPQIVGYVQQLHIHEHVPRHSNVQTDNSVSKVIPTLINVVDLTLGREDACFSFSQLAPLTQLAIMDKCKSVLSLTVHRMSTIPMEIFDHMHQLERLILDRVFFTDKPDALRDVHGPQVARQTTPYRIKHMHLRAYGIQVVGTLFPFLVERGIGMGTLETLKININQRSRRIALPSADFQAAKTLVRSSARSLKVLEVTISTTAPLILPDAEPLFDLSKMPQLEEWSLDGKLWNSEMRFNRGTTTPVDLSWLSKHLETIPSGRKFKRITLRPAISKAGKVVHDNLLDFESFLHFETLAVDKGLLHTESFSVHFSIFERENDDLGVGNVIQEQIQTNLPFLHALNLLHFRIYPRPVPCRYLD
ncbi:hypothetical protein CPC08DRAFT_763290 [Agrocybe pediades]|nr:hypothetical protein CPC08DRAFT_763290 [Agrocybe pediades]